MADVLTLPVRAVVAELTAAERPVVAGREVRGVDRSAHAPELGPRTGDLGSPAVGPVTEVNEPDRRLVTRSGPDI